MMSTVRVEGVAATNRCFRKVDVLMATKFGNDLKAAAEPVAEDVREIESKKWRGASIRTIRTRRRGVNVYVEQGARKVDGLHGNFGSLQMAKALVPALDENSKEIAVKVGELMEYYGKIAGFHL